VSPEKVEVTGYRKVEVRSSLMCASLVINEDGEQMELAMYPDESKALRKALKRAERRVLADR